MPHLHPDRILLVYNADEGLFNAINDWAHKIFSPATYECPLCRFTYGLSGMLKPWKLFLERQPCPVEFLYRPYFRKAHPGFAAEALPLVLVESQGRLQTLLTAAEIAEVAGLEPLIGRMQVRLANWSPPEAPPPHGTS